MINEPDQAFPYEKPSQEIIDKYQHIFDIKEPLPAKFAKLFFDKSVSLILLLISLPILFLIKVAYQIEGFLIKENKGPMLFFYWAISNGKRFRKYKIRLIKTKFIDEELAKKNDWLAYTAEWSEESRTYVGTFVKKFYLDELPQLWSIFKGEMSIVGPRPLCEMHYYRDMKQGNVSRFLIKGGLLGLGHINKGTSEMGKANYEYEYIDEYIKIFIRNINFRYFNNI